MTSGGELPPLTDAEMEALGELLAKAVPGPWPVGYATSTGIIEQRSPPDYVPVELPSAYRFRALIRDHPTMEDAAADNNLIVAAVNALPRLLATIAEQRELLQAVEWAAQAAPSDYLSACPICFGLYDNGHEPDCNLAASLSASPRSTQNE